MGEADRRRDKQKQVLKRGKEPVFHAALELHSRERWIYHPRIRDAVDAYLEGKTCDAQQLEPGRAVACESVPVDGPFQYSTEVQPANHSLATAITMEEYMNKVHALVKENGGTMLLSTATSQIPRPAVYGKGKARTMFE